MNSAREVKIERFSRTEGKTPAFVEGEVQKLLGVIETSTHTGLRDRALLGTLAYTFARIGAVVNLKVEDIHLGSGFCSGLRRRVAKRRSSPSTTSWRSSWMNTSSDRPRRRAGFSFPRRLGQNWEAIAQAARPNGCRGHAQTTAKTSWTAGSLFASLLPRDRHHEFSGK
jgi:integrase